MMTNQYFLEKVVKVDFYLPCLVFLVRMSVSLRLKNKRKRATKMTLMRVGLLNPKKNMAIMVIM